MRKLAPGYLKVETQNIRTESSRSRSRSKNQSTSRNFHQNFAKKIVQTVQTPEKEKEFQINISKVKILATEGSV